MSGHPMSLPTSFDCHNIVTSSPVSSLTETPPLHDTTNEMQCSYSPERNCIETISPLLMESEQALDHDETSHNEQDSDVEQGYSCKSLMDEDQNCVDDHFASSDREEAHAKDQIPKTKRDLTQRKREEDQMENESDTDDGIPRDDQGFSYDAYLSDRDASSTGGYSLNYSRKRKRKSTNPSRFSGNGETRNKLDKKEISDEELEVYRNNDSSKNFISSVRANISQDSISDVESCTDNEEKSGKRPKYFPIGTNDLSKQWEDFWSSKETVRNPESNIKFDALFAFLKNQQHAAVALPFCSPLDWINIKARLQMHMQENTKDIQENEKENQEKSSSEETSLKSHNSNGAEENLLISSSEGVRIPPGPYLGTKIESAIEQKRDGIQTNDEALSVHSNDQNHTFNKTGCAEKESDNVTCDIVNQHTRKLGRSFSIPRSNTPCGITAVKSSDSLSAFAEDSYKDLSTKESHSSNEDQGKFRLRRRPASAEPSQSEEPIAPSGRKFSLFLPTSPSRNSISDSKSDSHGDNHRRSLESPIPNVRSSKSPSFFSQSSQKLDHLGLTSDLRARQSSILPSKGIGHPSMPPVPLYSSVDCCTSLPGGEIRSGVWIPTRSRNCHLCGKEFKNVYR